MFNFDVLLNFNRNIHPAEYLKSAMAKKRKFQYPETVTIRFFSFMLNEIFIFLVKILQFDV